jgi:hypothetical protein
MEGSSRDARRYGHEDDGKGAVGGEWESGGYRTYWSRFVSHLRLSAKQLQIIATVTGWVPMGVVSTYPRI